MPRVAQADAISFVLGACPRVWNRTRCANGLGFVAGQQSTSRRYVALVRPLVALSRFLLHDVRHRMLHRGGHPPPAAEFPAGRSVAHARAGERSAHRRSPAREEDVDDTIRLSGRVTFDDQRVAHVFSPVTGRVARIEAALGERLHCGQPLAVITSPDIGSGVERPRRRTRIRNAAEHVTSRKKDLFDSHAASQADYEASEDNHLEGAAEKERVYQKGSALLRTGLGRRGPAGYTLTSPIEGVIARAVNSGDRSPGAAWRAGRRSSSSPSACSTRCGSSRDVRNGPRARSARRSA